MEGSLESKVFQMKLLCRNYYTKPFFKCKVLLQMMALVSICKMKSLIWLGAMKRKLKDLCYVSFNMSDLSFEIK